MAHAVAHAVWKVDSALPLRNISRLDNLYSGTLTQERTGAVAGMLFSAFGLLLASVGAFGVMSFATSRRTHEIGVRLTLGASPSDVLKMVLSWGGRLAAIGTGAGFVGVLVLNRFLIGTLLLVQSTEPAGYGMAAAMVGLATLVACWVPARRASSVDPILALRCE